MNFTKLLTFLLIFKRNFAIKCYTCKDCLQYKVTPEIITKCNATHNYCVAVYQESVILENGELLTASTRSCESMENDDPSQVNWEGSVKITCDNVRAKIKEEAELKVCKIKLCQVDLCNYWSIENLLNSTHIFDSNMTDESAILASNGLANVALFYFNVICLFFIVGVSKL